MDGGRTEFVSHRPCGGRAHERVRRRAAHAFDFTHGLNCAFGRYLSIAYNPVSCGALLSDSRGNRAADSADLTNSPFCCDAGLERPEHRMLHLRNLCADILGRSRRLLGWFFTSSATTAKPRPASPARAASIVAFIASRLVCEAMPVMKVDHVADAFSPWTVP